MGSRLGMVMYQIFRNRPQPSREAASYWVSSMAARAARYKMASQPTSFQARIRVTSSQKREGSCQNLIAESAMPVLSSASFTGPLVPSSSKNTLDTTTKEMKWGR